MDYDEKFTQTLIRIIKVLKLMTQAELSRRSGVSANTICSIVNGRRTASEDVKHKISPVFDKTYDGFLNYGKAISHPNVFQLKRREDTDPDLAGLLNDIKNIWTSFNKDQRESLKAMVSLIIPPSEKPVKRKPGPG